LAVLCWAGFGDARVLAGELAYGAGYFLAHESNVTQVPANPVPEWIQSLIAGFAYRQNTVDFDARLLAQLERRDYLHNTFSSNTGVYLNGAAVWAISPQRLVWRAEEIYREVRLDVTTPDVPSNRAAASSLSTGPDFTFRLDSTNTSEFGARYGRFDIKGPGDNVRRSGYLRWSYRPSPRTTLSLNYEPARVTFQDPVSFANFLREERFLRYDAGLSLTQVTLDVGTSRLTRTGAEQLNGRLVRLTTTYRPNSQSTLGFQLTNQYSDTASDLLKGVTAVSVADSGSIPVFPPSIDVVTGDVYYSRLSELNYVNRGGRMDYGLRVLARHVDYQVQNLDYDLRLGSFAWTWRLTGATQMIAYTEYLTRKFLNFDQLDTERNTSVTLNFGVNRNVNLLLGVGRLERSSTASQANFLDWRATVFLSYSSGPLYVIQPRR